jgi:hypothetical protein
MSRHDFDRRADVAGDLLESPVSTPTAVCGSSMLMEQRVRFLQTRLKFAEPAVRVG